MKKTGPASAELACDKLIDTMKGNKLNLVLFGEQSTEMGKAFTEVAQSNDKYTFYHTTADCAAGNGATANGVSIFRTFDDSPVHYAGAANEADVKSFVGANSVESLFKFTDDSVEAIFHDSKPAIIYFTDGEPPAAFAEASKTMKGSILFSYSGVSDGIAEQLGEFVGVTKEDMPCIRIIKPNEAGVEKFKYEGAIADVTAASVQEFV